MKTKSIVVVALLLFMMVGMASNGSAAPAVEMITLPDPTVQYQVGGKGSDPVATRYVDWAHDDFWSYSAQLLESAQSTNNIAVNNLSKATYGDYSAAFGGVGTGTLDLILYTGAGGQSNADIMGGTFDQPVDNSGGSTKTFVGSWGNATTSGSVVTTTVKDVLDYLHMFNPLNNTPVFMMDLNQTGKQQFLGFVGRVYLADPTNGTPIAGYEWAFDESPQGTGYSGSLRGSPGSSDYDYPGFSQIGNFDLDHPATAQYFSGGGGNLDYITYAPTMNLAAAGIDPKWLFVVEFHLGEMSGYDQLGNAITTAEINDGPEEIYLTGRYSPPSVPEPASLLLLGMGMIGLAGIRRKFQK